MPRPGKTGPRVETGIRTIGNTVDQNATQLAAPFGNPYLPLGSASVTVGFGFAGGLDQAAFVARYIAPGGGATSLERAAFVGVMDDYLKRHGSSQAALSDPRAAALFETLGAPDRTDVVERTLLALLAADGQGYGDPSSVDYRRYDPGYQAINTLFPGRLGYTENNLNGGPGGSQHLVQTGTLDLRGSTIQTQQRAATSRSWGLGVRCWSAARGHRPPPIPDRKASSRSNRGPSASLPTRMCWWRRAASSPSRAARC